MLSWSQFLFFLFLTAMVFVSKGQQSQIYFYDTNTDTLLIINNKVINTEKVLMNRQEFVRSDTFKLNQPELKLVSYKMHAISLGSSQTLFSDKPYLTQEMLSLLLNGTIKYKFIYLKDIILQSDDGRFVSPSYKFIKVTFTN